MEKKKLITITLSSILAVGITSSAIAIPITLCSNKNKTNTFNYQKTRLSDNDFANGIPFMFNNKTYLSMEEAIDDYIKTNPILTEQYIGSIEHKNEDGTILLDNNNLYKYNPNNISFAYQDADGRYTNNKEDALESFINPAYLVARYYDYKGNYFFDEEGAKLNMQTFNTMGIGYYEIKDKNNIPYHINPLNSEDILKLKTIALDSIINGNSNENFKLTISSIKNDVASKQNEFNNTINKEWENFLNNIFNKKIANKIMLEIKNILKNNNFIKCKIYIKPYILDNSSSYTNAESMEYNDDHSETKRFQWAFSTWNENKLSIETKDLNLSEFNKIFKIYTDLNTFKQYYTIKTRSMPGLGFHPIVQYAELNNRDLFNYFDQANRRFLHIDICPEPVNCNSEHWVKDKEVATILTESSTFTKSLGPDYCNDYFLTFGLRPYIDNSAKNSNNKSFIDLIRDFVKKNLKQILNESISEIYNNENEYKNLINFFKPYFINNNLDLNININANMINSWKNNDDVLKNYNRIPNILRNDMILNFYNENNNNNNKNPFVQFNNSIHSRLQTKFNDNSDTFHEVNYAMDIRQIAYLWNNKNYNNLKLSDYLNDPLGLEKINDYKNSDNNVKAIKKFFDCNLSYLFNIEFKNNNIINNKNLYNQNTLSTLTDNLEYFISYNNTPLFKINKSILLQNPNMMQEINDLFNMKRNNFNELNKYLLKNNSSYLGSTLDNLLINVSTSLDFENKKQYKNYSYNIYFDPTKNIDYDPKKQEIMLANSKNLTPTFNHLPNTNEPPELMKNGIYDAISLFNQNIKKMSTISSVNFDLINKLAPKDYIMLYNDNGLKPLNYAEILCGANYINMALTNPNSEINIAYDYSQLLKLEERMKTYNSPLKVYFIYCGRNLINSNKIEIDSNPSYVDSPELIISNALRNYILQPDPKYIMYKTDKNYELVKNNNVVLYTINFNNQKYYFDSYLQLQNKLVQYIKYNAYKIN